MSRERRGDGTLRVALDVTSAVDPRPSGVARYVRGLAAGLAAQPGIDLALLCRASRFRESDPRELFPGVPLRRWLDFGEPRGFDLFHAPDLRTPRRPPATLVATVHDLSALDRSDHASARFLARKRRWLAVAVRRAARVITHTAAVRDEIIARCGTSPDRVRAVPLWPGLPAAEERPNEERGDELLVIGGPSRRKRSERIVPLLAALERETGLRPGVAWCGSASESEISAFRLSLPEQVRDRVRFLGHIEDARLDRRLSRAAALLQLSDTEGFGMPLLEAARRRTPILAWRSPTAMEVVPVEGAFWLGGADEGLELRAFADREERARRVERAAHRAESFSREATVTATLEVYREAIKERCATVAAG